MSADHVGEEATEAAKETSTDSGVKPGRSPSAGACEPYRELIEGKLRLGRNAMAIYQDLVEEHGLEASLRA